MVRPDQGAHGGVVQTAVVRGGKGMGQMGHGTHRMNGTPKQTKHLSDSRATSSVLFVLCVPFVPFVLSVPLHPLRVHERRVRSAIVALIRVRTEVVALRLGQILRKISGAIAVE